MVQGQKLAVQGQQLVVQGQKSWLKAKNSWFKAKNSWFQASPRFWPSRPKIGGIWPWDQSSSALVAETLAERSPAPNPILHNPRAQLFALRGGLGGLFQGFGGASGPSTELIRWARAGPTQGDRSTEAIGGFPCADYHRFD